MYHRASALLESLVSAWISGDRRHLGYVRCPSDGVALSVPPLTTAAAVTGSVISEKLCVEGLAKPPSEARADRAANTFLGSTRAVSREIGRFAFFKKEMVKRLSFVSRVSYNEASPNRGPELILTLVVHEAIPDPSSHRFCRAGRSRRL